MIFKKIDIIQSGFWVDLVIVHLKTAVGAKKLTDFSSAFELTNFLVFQLAYPLELINLLFSLQSFFMSVFKKE